MILFFISLIIIFGSLAALVFVGLPVVRYAAAALCLVGVYLMYYYWEKKFVKFRNSSIINMDKLHSLNEDWQRKTEDLTRAKETVEASLKKMSKVPEIPETMSLMERVEVFKNYYSDDITGEHSVDYHRFFRELADAVSSLETNKAIGTKTTGELMKQLKEATLPLDEETKRKLNELLVQLALVSIDITYGYRSSMESHGSIATKLASGDIDAKQAAQDAKRANENVSETPKTIRVLQNLLKDYKIETKIVNDYIL